jgi:hypothetical protein
MPDTELRAPPSPPAARAFHSAAKARNKMNAETKNELVNAQLNDDDLAAIAGAARDLLTSDFVGIPLKFVKGPWYKHPEKNQRVKVGATDSFAVDVLSYACGWIGWLNRRPIHKLIGRPVDGFISPMRERLPDRDKSKWPLDKDGKRSDPWQENHQLVLKDIATGELLTWTTTSWYGRKAIGRLLDLYAREAKQHAGLMPVVTLSSHDESSIDYGLIPAPTLTVVDWKAFGDGAAPSGSRSTAPSLERLRPMLAIANRSPTSDPDSKFPIDEFEDQAVGINDEIEF